MIGAASNCRIKSGAQEKARFGTWQLQRQEEKGEHIDITILKRRLCQPNELSQFTKETGVQVPATVGRPVRRDGCRLDRSGRAADSLSLPPKRLE